MLVNVKFFKIKKIILLTSFFFIVNTNAFSIDFNSKIVNNLKNTNSIKFSFNQITNDKIETGNCILLFPKKLKCIYEDDKLKELIINDKRMAIFQKRYNKVYYYPIKKSPFLKILIKNDLIEFINKSEPKIKENNINLKFINEYSEEITVLFDAKTFDIKGWIIKDAFNNKINFLITVIDKNFRIKNDHFKIPVIN